MRNKIRIVKMNKYDFLGVLFFALSIGCMFFADNVPANQPHILALLISWGVWFGYMCVLMFLKMSNLGQSDRG
jgi:hypothetical protein